MTRSSMVRELVEEKYFLNDEEQRLLPKFASLLDNVIMNQYRVDLTDLKVNKQIKSKRRLRKKIRLAGILRPDQPGQGHDGDATSDAQGATRLRVRAAAEAGACADEGQLQRTESRVGRRRHEGAPSAGGRHGQSTSPFKGNLTLEWCEQLTSVIVDGRCQ